MNPSAGPPYGFDTITKDTKITKELILWLEQQQLIRVSNIRCDQCLAILHLSGNSGRKHDLHQLQCIDCRYQLSIRHGSFFENFSCSIQAIIQTIYLLREKVPMRHIYHQTGLSDHTVHGIYLAIADKVSQNVYSNFPNFTSEDIIEVDETKEKWAISNIPSYVTTIDQKEGNWVIGIRARNSTKVWLQPVVNRSEESLIPAIRQLVPETSFLVTDALRTYGRLQLYAYYLFVINKQQEGFSRMDEIFNIKVHVNTIEATWGKFREYLHRHHDRTHHHVFYACNFYMYDLNHSSYYNLIKM
jgi:ISXO2-like transposase domain